MESLAEIASDRSVVEGDFGNVARHALALGGASAVFLRCGDERRARKLARRALRAAGRVAGDTRGLSAGMQAHLQAHGAPTPVEEQDWVAWILARVFAAVGMLDTAHDALRQTIENVTRARGLAWFSTLLGEVGTKNRAQELSREALDVAIRGPMGRAEAFEPVEGLADHFWTLLQLEEMCYGGLEADDVRRLLERATEIAGALADNWRGPVCLAAVVSRYARGIDDARARALADEALKILEALLSGKGNSEALEVRLCDVSAEVDPEDLVWDVCEALVSGALFGHAVSATAILTDYAPMLRRLAERYPDQRVAILDAARDALSPRDHAELSAALDQPPASADRRELSAFDLLSPKASAIFEAVLQGDQKALRSRLAVFDDNIALQAELASGWDAIRERAEDVDEKKLSLLCAELAHWQQSHEDSQSPDTSLGRLSALALELGQDGVSFDAAQQVDGLGARFGTLVHWTSRTGNAKGRKACLEAHALGCQGTKRAHYRTRDLVSYAVLCGRERDWTSLRALAAQLESKAENTWVWVACADDLRDCPDRRFVLKSLRRIERAARVARRR